MKNQNFKNRLMCSIWGLKWAWISEKSFRTQILITPFVLMSLIYFKANPVWWGIFLLIISVTIAMELMNTALEYMCDALHPEVHPLIGRSKDCAAAAVFILSLTSIFIYIAFILGRFW